MRLVALAEFVKTEPHLAYEALIDVSSVDQSDLPQDESDSRFLTTYQLRSYNRKQHLMLVCPLDSSDTPLRAQPRHPCSRAPTGPNAKSTT